MLSSSSQEQAQPGLLVTPLDKRKRPGFFSSFRGSEGLKGYLHLLRDIRLPSRRQSKKPRARCDFYSKLADRGCIGSCAGPGQRDGVQTWPRQLIDLVLFCSLVFAW